MATVTQAPRLKTGLHQATLALAEALPGPQDVELELLMEMYYMVRPTAVP